MYDFSSRSVQFCGIIQIEGYQVLQLQFCIFIHLQCLIRLSLKPTTDVHLKQPPKFITYRKCSHSQNAPLKMNVTENLNKLVFPSQVVPLRRCLSGRLSSGISASVSINCFVINHCFYSYHVQCVRFPEMIQPFDQIHVYCRHNNNNI